MNINLSKGKSSIKKNWIRSNVEYFKALRFLLVHSSQYFPVVPSAACGEIWGKRYLCCICERYLFNKKSWYFELPCSETLLTICWKMRNIKFYSQHMFTWIQYGEPRVREISNLFQKSFYLGLLCYYLGWQMILRPF